MCPECLVQGMMDRKHRAQAECKPELKSAKLWSSEW